MTRAARVGLTGGIATGKSFCLAVFKQLGAETIDADVIARDVVAPGTEGLAEVTRRFGRSVLLPDGRLNRPALAARVFSDAAARQQLEAIIHPRVYAEVRKWFSGLSGSIGIADIPLLFETSRQAEFDAVVVAACRPEQQLARLMSRSTLSESEARARIAAQLPLAEKIAQADYVIDTSGTPEETASRTETVWNRLRSATPPQ